MEENKPSYQTVDDYIFQFPAEVQEKLHLLRNLIKETVPEVKEKISWQMPTYDLYGNLVHFAAHKNHIGFYPAPSGIEIFKTQLAEYKSSKGAIQFPMSKPLPLELIGEIVRYRAAENLRLAETKKNAKSKSDSTKE